MILLALASSLSGYLGAMGVYQIFEDTEVKDLRAKKKAKKTVRIWVAKRSLFWGRYVISSHSNDGGFVIKMSSIPFRD